VTSAGARDVTALPPAQLARQDVGYWAIVLTCITEGTLFAYLFSSYFYLGVSNASWPPSNGEVPTLAKPIVMTVLLVSSSVVLFFAARARETGGKGAYLVGTVVSIILGLAFLSIQAIEYHEKVREMPPGADAYASMFYLITGFHGTHVAFGLLFLIWTLLADARNQLATEAPVAVKNASLYWHFVDGVWLVVFTCLYLSPRWYR
jgi:Heme/copper-type cytochrome/quinol oxidase, subunit 3